MTNVLTFDLAGPKRTDLRITPCIDGVLFSHIVEEFERRQGYLDPAGSYGGIEAAVWDLPSMTALYRGEYRIDYFDGENYAELLQCLECGLQGCWPFTTKITLKEEQVVWSDFFNEHRPERDYAGLGPFTFDRQAYFQAVTELSDVWKPRPLPWFRRLFGG